LPIRNPHDVTQAALLAMERIADPRQRELLSAAARHLHEFVREVKLTEAEFQQACRQIARLGQLTTASHNEVVLTAGSLGLSALVCLLNNGQGGRQPTTANLMGPFWRDDAPPVANGGSLLRGATPGDPLFVQAAVADLDGRPVAGARVDVWHASREGYYENMDPGQPDMNLRGRFTTDAAGRIAFRTIMPASYPVPVDGVAGDLLRAQRRHNMRPAHVHFMIRQPGFKTQFSQVYWAGDPYLDTDSQFGATAATTGNYVRHGRAEPAPDGAEYDDWFSLEHRFVVEPGESTLPPPPVRGKAQGERPPLVRLQSEA
jgi:hydroxyquinol 1,2-dioxygenase